MIEELNKKSDFCDSKIEFFDAVLEKVSSLKESENQSEEEIFNFFFTNQSNILEKLKSKQDLDCNESNFDKNFSNFTITLNLEEK